MPRTWPRARTRRSRSRRLRACAKRKSSTWRRKPMRTPPRTRHDAKKALEGTDAKVMDTAREHLTQASHKLAEAMYKAQAAPAGGDPAPGGDGHADAEQKKKDEGVIDAEYVDVEDKK